jgi:hypothetical protein
MHTISSAFYSTMVVNIHNQCSDLKLKDMQCFTSGAIWTRFPDMELDVVSMMRTYFMTLEPTFGGALIYFLERKHVKTHHQSASNLCQIFIGWKSEGYKELRAFVHLIEYDKQVKLNLSKLQEYYQRYIDQVRTYTDSIKDTWLTHDGIILMTELELNFALRDGVLNITISEGIKDDHVRSSERIYLNR